MSEKTNIIMTITYYDLIKLYANDSFNLINLNSNIGIAFGDNNGFGTIKDILNNTELFNWLISVNLSIYVIEKTNAEKYYEFLKTYGFNINIFKGPENPLISKDKYITIYKKGKFKKKKDGKEIILHPEFKKFLDMKFDAVIMNPPYGTIFIPILNKVVDNSKNVICICPSIFLKYRLKERLWKQSEFMNGRLKNVNFLPYEESDRIFGVGNSIGQLCIYEFCEKGNLNINDIMFKNITEQSLYTKIFKVRDDKLPWENANTKRHGEQVGYYVNLYTWHIGTNAYNTCIREDGKSTRVVYFDNENQVNNFKNSFKTKFMDFYVKNIVLAGNGITDKCFMFSKELYNLPWSNKRFCEYFNITGYISDIEAEPGSEWEIILNEMKE